MEKIKVDFIFDEDKEIIEKMYQDYLATPKAIKEISSLGIPEEVVKANIIKINDLVQDIRYCANCPGIEKCQKENPLFNTQIIYRNGLIDRQIRPCKKYLAQIKFEQNYLIRDFDDKFLNIDYKDLEKTAGKIEAANKYMRYKKDGINDWIYLTGKLNTGKTFLAIALANNANRAGKGYVIFADCVTRFKELTDYYYKDKNRYEKEIARYSTVPVLVLDNFGNELISDVVRDAIVLPIISNRANKKLFTIITSDFKINDIKELYSNSQVGKIKASQLADFIRLRSGKEINLGEIAVH